MNRNPPPPARRGERITARRENEGREATASLRPTVSPGDRAVIDRNGTYIRRAGAASGDIIAKSGGAGVPAMSGLTPGSATVTRYAFGATDLTVAEAVTAYNIAGTPVQPNKFLILTVIDDRYVVVMEVC